MKIYIIGGLILLFLIIIFIFYKKYKAMQAKAEKADAKWWNQVLDAPGRLIGGITGAILPW